MSPRIISGPVAMNNKKSPILWDSVETDTTKDQQETEEACSELFEQVGGGVIGGQPLNRQKHRKFLHRMLSVLPEAFVSLDASRPWLVYWASNALAVMGDDLTEDMRMGIGESILACQSPTGGIGGGNGQLPHLAPTYAGITALAHTRLPNVWKRVDRTKCYNWLMSLKDEKVGSFAMHRGGETDTRATYCAMAIASLLNIMTDELIDNVGDYISSCQTHEGGFGAGPGSEAHGGYAFCALGALCLIGPPDKSIPKYINVDKALKWLSSRQMYIEGGFSGRTNKLVDGCYNHWVGGCWALLENAISNDFSSSSSLWDRQMLANYTLICCQFSRGGLRDKPGKNADAYHSNYTLCGLSGAQYKYTYVGDENGCALGDYGFNWKSQESTECIVNDGNRVLPINPVHVLPEGLAEDMHNFYKQQDN